MKEERKLIFNDADDLNEILDKVLKIQNNDKSPSFLRKVIYIVSGLSALAFVVLICASIYMNHFTTESILTTLLAFFSIFISIFFFFKADETSNKFYDSSYRLMKDISVTLGKIEERFSEKLNSINDKISHFDNVSKETSEEIEAKQKDKDKMINDLIEKANLNEEEKKRYKEALEEKENQIQALKEEHMQALKRANALRRRLIEESRKSLVSPGINEELLRDYIENAEKNTRYPESIRNTQKAANRRMLKE